MKTMKKLVALIIAMVIVSAMAYTAFAATITITQTAPSSSGTVGAETYELYKIFDVTKTSSVTEDVTTQSTLGSGTATGFAYTISTSNPWFAVLWDASTNQPKSGQTWVTLTQSAGDEDVYNVTYDSSKNTEADAKEFAAWLLKNGTDISPTKTMTSGSGTTSGTATATVDDGYYLITSSLGTNLVLATSNININTKNQYVTDDKKVSKTNWNVGDHVEYTITVNLPASIDYSKKVIVHDTLDQVLSFDNNVRATCDGDEFSAFEVKTSTSDDCTFEIEIDIAGLKPTGSAAATAHVIVFTYTAELLEAAAADEGFVNKEFTEYSKYKTIPNEIEAKTFDFDLEKEFEGDSGTNLVATFNLYAKSGTSKVKIDLIEEEQNKKYVKKDSKTPNSGTETDTISAKIGVKLNVRGLAEGTYYLTELTTATGYNMLTDDIEIKIDGSGTVSVVNAGELFTAASGTITVINNSGTVLPSTGGMGTTILYIAGAILVLGAGILLVTKRRMGN